MYKSFCFTIRPLKGINDETTDALCKWLSKQEFAFACLEMEGEARHCHGQIWNKVERDKGSVNRSLENICARTIEDWNPSQNMVMRRGTKIAYSDDFVEEYLAKEDNIIFNNPPFKEISSDYYPSQEEQERVKAKSNSKNSLFLECKTQFLQQGNEVTLENVAIFVRDGMYKNDTITVIQDDRRRKQFVTSLFFFIQGGCSLSAMMTKEQFDNLMLKKGFELSEGVPQ